MPVVLPGIEALSVGVDSVGTPFVVMGEVDAPVDFCWSAQHYRVYQLVREFSEETHANY